MVKFAGTVAIAAAVLAVSSLAARQDPRQLTLPPAAIPADTAGSLASGWSLLAAGRIDDAGVLADQLLAGDPRSAAVLALALEVALARGGSAAGLDAYERWLGARPLEEPGALRRVARALLLESARQTDDVRLRIIALQALSRAGVVQAERVLQAGGADDRLTELRALAELGNDGAVDQVIDRLRTTTGSRGHDIETLKRSRSLRAAPVLVDLLRDPLTENRASAADALGAIGGAEAIGALRNALSDEHRAVRLAAAGALFKLGDTSGIEMLRQLATSEHPSMRRSAAWLLAPQPDEAWRQLVRGLATDPDPAIRLDAARLLAPHDAAFARALFASLAVSTHPGIREEAGVALAESPIASLPSLRPMLRHGTPRVKVRAAERVLALTR